MNTKAQQSPKTDTKTRASNISRMIPTSSRGGAISSATKITLGLDAESDYNSMPRQIQLTLTYLGQLGGTATIADVQAVATKAPHGMMFWGSLSGAPYEQDVRKIVAHYSGTLLGYKEWSKKIGKAEILKIVA